MLNNKTVLVNGCSFSRGPNSWPYHLQKIYDFNLVNLAQAGAGNSYIHESTIEEISYRAYDFVIIMWTGLARMDFKVENITQFKNSKYTSQYQKTRNDWPQKTIYPVNDQDYVDDSWVFGCGFMNNEQTMVNANLFNGLYKHMDIQQFVYHALIKMISLQSFLKAQNIPYVFTFYNDYVEDLKTNKLYELLDQNNIFAGENIFTLAQKYNDLDDTNHPMDKTHAEWATLLKDFINA